MVESTIARASAASIGKLADYAKTPKGSHVLVQSYLRTREYDRDGLTHRIVELRADSIGRVDRAVRRDEAMPAPMKRKQHPAGVRPQGRAPAHHQRHRLRRLRSARPCRARIYLGS